VIKSIDSWSIYGLIYNIGIPKGEKEEIYSKEKLHTAIMYGLSRGGLLSSYWKHLTLKPIKVQLAEQKR